MRALLTVNNKKGIVEFAKKLEQLNVEIVSAGATYEMLKDSGISVADVSTMIYHNNSLDCIIKTLYTEVCKSNICLNNTISNFISDFLKLLLYTEEL